MFDNKLTRSFDNIQVIHKSIVELTKDLYLAGFGGSVPSTHISPPEICGTRAWEGYPHRSDDSFGQDLLPFVETIKAELTQDDSKQFIFVTHNGPYDCDTTLFQKYDITSPKITSGSVPLRSALESLEIQSNCVCHIHGHTHLFRPGSSLVGVLPIVNPGSLMEGNFSVIQLERQENGKFLLSAVNSFRFKP